MAGSHLKLGDRWGLWLAKTLFCAAAGGASVFLFAMNDCAKAGDLYLYHGGVGLLGGCWFLAAVCMVADAYVRLCDTQDLVTYVASQTVFAACLCAFSALYVYFTSNRELLYFALGVLVLGWAVLASFASGCCFHRGGRCPHWELHQVPGPAEGVFATAQTLFVICFLTLVVWIAVYDYEIADNPVAGCGA